MPRHHKTLGPVARPAFISFSYPKVPAITATENVVLALAIKCHQLKNDRYKSSKYCLGQITSEKLKLGFITHKASPRGMPLLSIHKHTHMLQDTSCHVILALALSHTCRFCRLSTVLYLLNTQVPVQSWPHSIFCLLVYRSSSTTLTVFTPAWCLRGHVIDLTHSTSTQTNCAPCSKGQWHHEPGHLNCFSIQSLHYNDTSKFRSMLNTD